MITLRPLQVSFMDALRSAMRNHRRVCAVAPTGFGKRIIIVEAITKMAELGRRAMVVTDRQLLVRQAAAECAAHGIEYGIIMGDIAQNPDALVQICSLQTLERRKWHDNPMASVIFVDEAHKTPQAYARLFNQYPDAWVDGFTATPVGPDDKLLLGLYDIVIEPVQNTDLIPEWLLPTRVICPFEPDADGCSINTKRISIGANGEFNSVQSSAVTETMYVHANVWEYYQPWRDMQAIVFVPRVAFGQFMVKEFAKRGIPAELICAATNDNDRQSLFRRFESRECHVLVSVDVLREGFDAPVAQLMIDLQMNAKLRTWVQKTGRIRRKHDDQQYAVCLDFAGNYHRLGWHPDDDPEWPTDPTTTSAEIRQKKKEESAPDPWECPKCHYQLSPCEKIIDGKCPHCGLELRKSTRRIVMGNGQMREVSTRKRKRRETDDSVKTWFSILYPIVRSPKGLSLGLARKLYFDRTGQWPDHKRLPKCPEPKSEDWKRKASIVFPELARRR